MAGRNQHVVPHEEGWAIQEEGRKRVSSVFSTKREAIDTAREIASRSGGDLVVHGRTGQIFYKATVPVLINEDEIRRAVRQLADAPKRANLDKGSSRKHRS